MKYFNFHPYLTYIGRALVKNVKSDLPYKVKKKIFSDFNIFGVKRSAFDRLEPRKKNRGQNIDPSQSYGQMNFQKIKIHRGDPVNLKNYDFILFITLARINILTSSFFLGSSLSKALRLTPKILKSEKKFFLTL